MSMKTNPHLKQLIPAMVALGLLLPTLSPLPGQTKGRSNCWIEPANGDTLLFLGDTVEFQIMVDTKGEDITGVDIFITIDPAVFKPILDEYDQPFTPGILFQGLASPSPVYQNRADCQIDFGCDVWGDPDANGIALLQLNYVQKTAPGGSPRYTVTGDGPVAFFSLEIVGLPSLGYGVIEFDDQKAFLRETRYNLWDNEAGISSDRLFQVRPDYIGFIAGVAIDPPLADTVITPGSSLNIWLGGHFTTGLLGVDSTDAVWSNDLNPPYHKPAGSTFNFIPEAGPTTRLEFITAGWDHDSLDVLIQVQATDTSGAPTYTAQQRWKVYVDYKPVFDVALPAFTFNEDTPLPYLANSTGGGTIFTDLDDSGTNIQAWLDPDTLVHLTYDAATNTFTFDADTNWFGSHSASLFVKDALGVSADTLLAFTVNPINDPPVVDFDNVSALGDTVVIHRATPDTLDLNLFVADVDDPVLTWSISNPDPTNLSDTLLSGDLLLLLADSNANFVDIDLVLTATDDSSATGSDTLVVSIRPWPPDIIIVEDIRINSQDTPPAKGLDLTQWVTDPDTPPAAMTWAFRALDADTYANDDSVTFSPTSGSVIDTVTISVPSNYSATDLLEMTVTDDANNTDIDTAQLFIFDGDAPMIFPLPGLTIYRDTTYAGILDLDDYVADILDDPSNIDWTSFGGDSLESFSINSYSHEVTITTNSTFIGNLTVSLVAENTRGLRDTSDLAILVSRRFDGPPLWYAVPAEVEVVHDWTTDLFTYGEICFDESPTDSIDFIYYCDTTLLTVTVGPLDSVKLTTPILIQDSTTYLYFSARDEIDSVSYSDTITVNVKDSFSPVWQRIPTISVKIGETYSGLFLRDYVSDRDTPDSLLTIDVESDDPFITFSYNSVTTELTVSASVRTGDSWLSIAATDDKGNTATSSVHVVVFAVADYTPPVGGLTYFFNPATDKWIHYVVAADSTADISRFTWHYSYGTPPRDYSNSLSFVMKDSLPGAVTWTAPYHFQNEGSYVLTVTITDAANNILDPSPTLHLSVGFSKAIGGALASPDQQLTVTYPPALIPNGKLLIISEDYPPDSIGQPTAKIVRAGAKEKAASQAPATVYSLDTNLPEPILVTLTYRQKRDIDPYYSFYELEEDRLVKIETYTSTEGHFEAAATLDRDIVFAPSDTPARNAPLPDAELFCYPNPFNATIQVRFLLRQQDRSRIVIYDLLGREIYASPRQILEPGVHAFSWHSIDKRGLPAPSGLYFIRLETDGGKIITRKVTLLK